MKKLISLLLTVCLLLGIVNIAAADVPADWEPFAERVKTAMRSASSSARTDSVSVGCVTKQRRAASLIEPHAATASAYLSCWSVMWTLYHFCV